MFNIENNQIQKQVPAGDCKVSMQPSVELKTERLACGLAISAYDPVRRVGGLLHTLLPDSHLDEKKAADFPALFVDTGIKYLLDALKKINVNTNRLEIKLVGGVDVLSNESDFQVGQENIEKAHDILKKEKLEIKKELSGGNIPMTLTLRLCTGEVVVSLDGFEDIIL